MGRRDISIRNDLIKSLRMVAGQEAVDACKGCTDAKLREIIEGAFKALAA